jgi:transposase
VGWLKENRRVGTRYDKLATSFLAFVNLAIIRRYLRLLAPDDPSDRA